MRGAAEASRGKRRRAKGTSQGYGHVCAEKSGVASGRDVGDLGRSREISGDVRESAYLHGERASLQEEVWAEGRGEADS